MIVYLGLFTLIILLSVLIFAKGVTNKKKKIFLFLAFGFMFLIMGFRSENVGTDTRLYCNIFQEHFSFNFGIIKENGDSSFLYSLYNKIVSLISTDYRAIIIANSIVICALTALFIYKNSDNVVFSTLFFMTFYHFFSAMNISRQYIAVMIICNAFYFLKNKKPVKYILLCIIATLIHNTAIVSFIMLPFLYINPTKRNIFIYFAVIVIGMIFMNKIMTLFSVVFGHYTMYFEKSLLTEVGENRKVVITVIYIVFAILLIYLLKNKTEEKESNYIDLYLLHMINLITIIIGIISLKIMLLSRIEVYFSIFEIILIPKVLNKMKNKRYIYIAFVVIMIIPMYIQLKSNNSTVLPYHNWLLKI